MAHWAKLEAFLAEHHGWFRLSDGQQRALPEAAELFEIDARLGSLFDERAAILRRLPGLKAEGRQAALLKLEVAARVLEMEGRDEAYGVLTSATRDLKSL